MSYKEFSLAHKVSSDKKPGDKSKDMLATDQPVKEPEAPAIVTPSPKS